MFDLPVKTKEARREYHRFHAALIKEGFSMMQYSVYARFFASEESSEAHRKRIRERLPPAGQVRLLAVTDRQFGKMEVFCGKKRECAEKPPQQMMLF